MIRRLWTGPLVAALTLLLNTPVLAQQVLARGLTDPFRILVDNVYVYWNEGVAMPNCRVSRILKGGSSSPTVRVNAGVCWPDHPDMAQDSLYLYFPMNRGNPPAVGEEQIVRLAKAGLSGPADLLNWDRPPPNQGFHGQNGVLEVNGGKLYYSVFSFDGNGQNQIRSFSKLGINAAGATTLLANTGGGRVTSMTSDNVYLYWGHWTGAQGSIRRIPLVGGAVTRLVALAGSIPTSIVTPTTAAGGGSIFWLEANPNTLVANLKQRRPDGQILFLARNLSLFPRIGVFAAHALAVSDRNVYFFRRVAGVNQLARVPIGGGVVRVLAAGAGVGNPMGLALDATHAYWADRGAGPRSGAIKRLAVPQPP